MTPMKTEPKNQPMSTPNELQRWMPYSSCAGQRGYMEKEDAGQWVRFSDIEPLIRSHQALVKALADAVEFGTNMPQNIQDRGLAALAAAKEVGKLTRAARE